ncbi:phage tail assembly chaperone [Thalassomonas haliotis]|uniref:Phage tail assembly chaperone n=2 Tax=Thalassomonas haliotis TaxID=485448 RepID=A0ABY7VPF5_9GAMM|nr:phage tail assembly chaperone [Thalassomonas haliotis]
MGFTVNEAQVICNNAIGEEKWRQVRSKRDHLIALTDWTQMPDSPLSAEQKAHYVEYRQLLRDLPQSTANPDEIVWPVKPQ